MRYNCFELKILFLCIIVNILNKKDTMKKTLTILLLALSTLTLFSMEKVEFTLDNNRIETSPNKTFEISVKFSIPQGDHIYGENTKTGLPTKINVVLPEGFALEKIEFPPTKKFEFLSIVSEGYSGNVPVKIAIKAPAKSTLSAQKLSFQASWLACSDTCVPDEKTLEAFVQVINSDENPEHNQLLFAILGAILGGLILNVMPCVFPVIGLKIMSFAGSGKSSKISIILNGIFFSGGIIATFTLLGIALATFKTLGETAGWGFQLQNPMFTISMAGIFWLLALSFLGIWEFGGSISSSAAGTQPKASNQYISSVFSGILAVLVASPCVAPFMGSAVGFALTGEASAFETVLVIASVGIGMSIPYIFLACFPSLTKKLPKAGKWLDTLKKILSIPLFITVGWLIWVFNQQGGNLASVAIAFILLAIGAFLWGKYANILNKTSTRITTFIVCVLILLMSIFIVKGSIENNEKQEEVVSENSWSDEKVNTLLKEGKIVFVDFTASWCLTCQYNKQIIFSSKIEKLFKENNVEIIIADWTNKNDKIGAELKKYGRAGVPLYLLFSPKSGNNPQILPSILTQSIIVEAVDKIKQ